MNCLRKYRLWIIAYLLVFLGIESTYAQMNAANRLYDGLEYSKAIPLYLKALKKGDSFEASKKLADCYYYLRDYENAEVFYAKASKFEEATSEVKTRYGQVLRNNNKHEEANEVFVVYATQNPGDMKGKNLLLSYDQIRTWDGEPVKFEIKNLEEINTPVADFSPVIYKDGVVFVSEREEDHFHDHHYSVTDKPYLSIYHVAQEDDSTFKKPTLFSPAISSDYHSGPISFNAEHTEAAMTRVLGVRRGKKHYNRPQLFIAKKRGKSWGIPSKFPHNNPEYALAHPALSYNGSELYFVSDMPGGHGGKDIYVSTRGENGWTEPKNLGKEINSAGDEMFPFINRNNELYFSSDGHIGYGGLDIFVSMLKDGSWSKPENMKAPINSTTDDFGITFMSESNGYFSSNRPGGKGGDDIWRFSAKKQSIKGLFLYSELDPARNSKIQLLDANNTVLAETFTNEKGEFMFDNLMMEENYMVMVDENDIKFTEKSRVYITNSSGEKVMNLSKKKGNFFEFQSLPSQAYDDLPPLSESDESLNVLTVFGMIYETLPGDLPPGMEVYALNDKGEVVFTTTLDEKGEFEFKNLPANNTYTFKLRDNDDNAQILILNDEREVVETLSRNKNGDFQYELLAKDNATFARLEAVDQSTLYTDMEGQIYQTLPGDIPSGMEVYLIDDNGEIAFTTMLDENGNFDFKQLPPDKHYTVKLKDNNDFRLLLMDEDSQMLKAMDRSSGGDFEYETLSRENLVLARSEEIDESVLYTNMEGQIYQTLPGDIPSGMEVYLVDDNGEIAFTTMIDENGNFDFKQLPPDKNYKILLKDGTEDFKLMVRDEDSDLLTAMERTSGGDFEYETLKRDELALAAVSETDASMLYTDMEGQIYQELPGDIPPGLEVYLVDDNGEIAFTALVDEKGNFNFENLPRDRNYTVKLKNEDDFKLKIADESGALAEVEKTDGNYVFDPASIEIETYPSIFFSLNSPEISQEAANALDKLAKVLKSKPNKVIVVSSYADSRGSSQFNLKLTTNRANNAINYLANKGISKVRMKAKAYGESKLVNKCGDGSDCTEEEHAQNRRAEIKIIEKYW